MAVGPDEKMAVEPGIRENLVGIAVMEPCVSKMEVVPSFMYLIDQCPVEWFDVLKIKDISLDKCVFDLLVCPTNEHLVVPGRR